MAVAVAAAAVAGERTRRSPNRTVEPIPDNLLRVRFDRADGVLQRRGLRHRHDVAGTGDPHPGPAEIRPGELGAALGDRWYQFFGYVLSFVLLGNLWLSHHHVWQLIRRVAPPVQALNLLMLLFVAFIPVPTSLIA